MVSAGSEVQALCSSASRVKGKAAEGVRRGHLGQSREKYVQILGSAGKDAIHRSVAVKTLSSVISALVIETRLSPELFDEKTMKQATNRIFDALLLPKLAQQWVIGEQIF